MTRLEIIRTMLIGGRAGDLSLLMEGESPYSREFKGDLPKTRGGISARVGALEHVKFVAKYGLDTDRVVEGKMVYTSYPDEFEKWINMGAPGIQQCELDAYLKERPLPKE